MSQINLKSISGITSITTPAGVDNQLTVHTNDTTEKLKVTSDGVNVTGVITATGFVGNITGNVTGGASSITGTPDVSLGNVNAGIITATSFIGSGSQLTGISGVSVANQADNRIITNTGTTDALNAESRFTFDGSTATIGDQSSNTSAELLVARGEAIGGGTGPVVTLKHGPSGGTQRTHEIYSYVGDLRIVADSNENMEFHTGGSESLRISSNKNVSVANTITAGQVGLTTTNTAIRNTGVSTAYGTLIFNSDTNQLQVYTHDNIWQKCNEGVVTNTGGGTISDNTNRTNFITHTFNSPGTFTTDGQITEVEVMVIGGGGGGGGRRYGAGGGAGGVIFKSGITLTGPAAIVIGSGGSSNSQNRGDAGSNSTFAAGTPLALTGKGGGGGGSYDGTGTGAPGGSGGGCTSRGSHSGGSATQPGTHSPGTDYGYRGGNYGGIGNGYSSPGGGGAGGTGTDTNVGSNGGGNGGIGVQLSISGGATYYAGGGAGSIYYQVGPASGNPGPASHYGAGGNGGGGVSNSNLPGSYAGGSPPGNGAANSGGGGAGSHAQAAPYNVFSGNSGGSGGSGKVIIAYPKSSNPTVQAS
mgnify:FL=1